MDAYLSTGYIIVALLTYYILGKLIDYSAPELIEAGEITEKELSRVGYQLAFFSAVWPLFFLLLTFNIIYKGLIK